MSKIHVKKLMAFLIIFVMMIAVVPNICIIANADYENTHTNTGNQRVDIVEIAKTQIGYHEGANNDTKYNRWLGALSGYPAGGYGYAWCQSFVSWCAAQANVSTSEIKRASGTVTVKQSFINNGTYHKGPYEGGSYIPKSGDIIYFYSSGTSSKHHVGIVSGCDGSTVYTIEGNSSDMVCERSYSVNYGNIRGYGCPRYIEPDLKPPTYSNLTVDKTMIAVGEEITFTASSDYATGFTIGIDNEVERYLTQGMENGKLTFSFDKAGEYGAYVTSYNSLGYVDSNWVGFTVYDSAPTYSNLEADKTMIAIGEEITFTASSDYATGFTIGIDNEKERYLTQGMENGSLTLTFNQTGNYGAYVTSYNSAGYVDSSWINFRVYDSSAINIGDSFYARIKNQSSSLYFTNTGSTINGQTASNSNNQIWKFERQADNSYKIISQYDGLPMDVLGAETVDGTDIRTWTDNGLSAQRYYIYNKFNSYYIRPVCSDKFVDMAIGTEDKNVATWGYGVDWEPQKFDITEVPEFIPGDINCDLSVSVADAVLLQKWLLGTSNATLENWKAGDLCKDNRIDVFDMIEMRKLLIQNK